MPIETGLMGSDLICPLPGCSGTLYLEMTGCMGLGVPSEQWPEGGTLGPIKFEDMHTTTWSVICDDGHVVGLPENSSDDYAEPFSLIDFMAKFLEA